MKILYFNLGSIANRINSWETEGFKSIFQQDVVLWGPIPDEKFVYEGKEIPMIRLFEETSIMTVFDRLPENWYPDIVTCETSVLNFVPDIYLCPVKTILFAFDAWADTIYNRGLIELFDFVDYGIIDRSLNNEYQVRKLPLSNCAVSLPDNDTVNIEFENREIDVISIANYNSGFYHERYSTLYNLARSNNSGINIRYVSGIKRKEINSYYQQSKIVLDWAHTLSNRSFEAALNGCLLFSNEDNPVMREFWIPGEEYVPYNEKNLPELITYYLNHTSVAKKIIDKAYEKIKSNPPSLGQSRWEQILKAHNIEINIPERIKRTENIPEADLYFRLATSFLYNYNYNKNFPENWRALYFKRIDTSLKGSQEVIHKIPPLVQAARLAFILNDKEKTELYLSELELILPDYAWIFYLRAREFYNGNDMDRALIFSEKSIKCGMKAPELLQKYILPVIEKNNSCDGRRITDFLWQSVYGHNNEFQVKALFHLSYEIIGDISCARGETDKSIDAYTEAVSNIAIPGCLNKLCGLLVGKKQFVRLEQIAENARKELPYDSRLVLYHAAALCRINQKKKAIGLLREHQNALNSFFGYRKIDFVKRSLKVILMIRFFNRYVISEALLTVLKIINRGRNELV